MEGKHFRYQNFIVYPEYCGLTLDQLLDKSNLDTNFHIASLQVESYPACTYQNVAAVAKEGNFLYHRSKYRLHLSEQANTQEGPVKPEVVTLDGENVLILICYEIVFPEDYLLLPTEKVDLVIHMVGHPMTDSTQKECWLALQKAISLVYKCPVVCCCGGDRGEMNITGVIDERSIR